MGPPSHMRSVVDRNVVMRRIPVLKIPNLFQNFILINSSCVIFKNEILQTEQKDLIFINMPYILIFANY